MVKEHEGLNIRSSNAIPAKQTPKSVSTQQAACESLEKAVTEAESILSNLKTLLQEMKKNNG